MSVTHRAKMGVSNHTERKAALGSGTSSWNHTDLHIAGLSGKCHSSSGLPHTDSISPLLSGPSCLPCPGDRWLYSVLLAAPTNSQAFGDLKELRFTLHCCGSQKHSMSFTRWKSGPWSGQAGPDLKEALAENHFLALSSAPRHSGIPSYSAFPSLFRPSCDHLPTSLLSVSHCLSAEFPATSLSWGCLWSHYSVPG